MNCNNIKHDQILHHTEVMKTELVWSQKAGTSEVYDVCQTSDTTKIFACAGTKVSVMSSEGDIIRVIDTPHTAISGMTAHPTEQKIVTIGLDNTVVFMDTSGTALFKYGHNTEIQCCGFSPDGNHFLTGADGDIGLYSNGAQRVNKIRTDQMIRAIAWSPSSKWFVLATEQGTLIFLDIEGKEFNRCEVGAPIWHMKIVKADFFKQEQKKAEEKSDDEPEIERNEVGVYGKSIDDQAKEKDKKEKEDEFKKSATAEAFIRMHKIDEERLIMVSWDQKYRVINPGSLSHSGVLLQQRRIFSGKKKQKLQNKENPFLLAESRLPFIPLTFELIKQYAAVSGVGGKVVILNAETGAILLDLFQVNEMDPFIIQCPKSLKQQKTLEGAAYKEAYSKALKKKEDHTLSYFGLNNTYVYSMKLLDPCYLVLGLQSGIVICLKFQFNAVDAVYKNYYAVREGLTSVVVKNMTTSSETRLDVGSYVQRIAISANKLVILSGIKLDVYTIKDQTLQKREIESVLRQEHQRQKYQSIKIEYQQQHEVRFQVKFVCVSSEHFIVVGPDFVTALTIEGTKATSWRFKDTVINCCKVIGGVAGQENIIIGTQDGRVLLLKIGNMFPIEAIKHYMPIQAIDVNAKRDLISIIDSSQKLLVYDYFSGNMKSQTNEPVYTIPNISSCAFDLVLANVIAISSLNKIHICIDGTIVYTHTVPYEKAHILIQNGSCNFNVNQTKATEGFGIFVIDATEIPMTPNVTHHVKKVYQYLAAGVNDVDFEFELDMAVQAAYLGVPQQYWMDIAIAALFCGKTQIAKECFSFIGNVRVLKILAELQQQKKQEFQLMALALSLVGNFADAAMLFAASSDSSTATELLFFTRQDGLVEIGPFTSLIGAITQREITRLLNEYSQRSNLNLSELKPLPNLALYFKLGSSEEDMMKFRQDVLETGNKQVKTNKYMDFLQIYESQPVQQGTVIQAQQYQYSQDFRIMLRRELQQLTVNMSQKQEILSKHAKFLESISDWQAASSSWMDAGDCEKAVEVLIMNKQTNTLLKLMRMLPPLNQKKSNDQELEDDFVEVRKEETSNNQNLVLAFQMVLRYFESIGDFESAMYIAKRLGDQVALLRLFVSQNMWEQVEDLGTIYPEMLPSIHEARAAAYLREGNFMAALERLRLAGNNEKEVAMIRALIDAAVVECKFDMARSLICQLATQMAVSSESQYFQALKASRSKILVMSAYMHLMQYILQRFNSPDPSNFNLMNFMAKHESDPAMITICTFLANYSMLPQEICRVDEQYLQKYESMESMDQGKVRHTSEAQFVSSSTRPQLGSLSQLDLGGSGRSLPTGVPEQLVWLVLQQVSGQSPSLNKRALEQLMLMRLPAQLQQLVRQRYMTTKSRNQPDAECDRCPRCKQPLELMQQQLMTSKDQQTVAALPMCSPALSDVCAKCGIPVVRSAISLKILPLILIEPGEDSSVLELIEHIQSVKIADSHGQVFRIDADKQNLDQQLRESPVADDGRGVVLPKELYNQIGPTKSFVVNDSASDPKRLPELVVGGVVKRIYVNNTTEEVHYCPGCQFFFTSEEFEMAYVLEGKCPVCQNKDLIM